jgi:hypothetical protein
MLLRDDIAELWNLRDDSKAVMCVHHDYKTKMQEKYLGAKNQDYPRKNWSSVMLWNCGHPANRRLTSEFVQQATGAQLHRFTWLGDELIGTLPKVWNWCFHEFADAPMAEEWHRERALTDFSVQREPAKQA